MGLSFKGVDISSVAPFKILNVYAPAPPIVPASQKPALYDGAFFVRKEYGVRVITVTGSVIENETHRRQEWISSIREWASSKIPAPLTIPQEANGYLLAVCTQLPDATARDWWETITISFTAFDPLFRSRVEHATPIPIAMQNSHTETPIVRIEQNITDTITNPSWANGELHITIAGDVPPGNLSITFDKTTQGITHSSFPGIQAQLSIDSRYWELVPGANTITCENGAGGTLFWRERWV